MVKRANNINCIYCLVRCRQWPALTLKHATKANTIFVYFYQNEYLCVKEGRIRIKSIIYRIGKDFSGEIAVKVRIIKT